MGSGGTLGSFAGCCQGALPYAECGAPGRVCKAAPAPSPRGDSFGRLVKNISEIGLLMTERIKVSVMLLFYVIVAWDEEAFGN